MFSAIIGTLLHVRCVMRVWRSGHHRLHEHLRLYLQMPQHGWGWLPQVPSWMPGLNISRTISKCLRLFYSLCGRGPAHGLLVLGVHSLERAREKGDQSESPALSIDWLVYGRWLRADSKIIEDGQRERERENERKSHLSVKEPLVVRAWLNRMTLC